MPNTLVERIKAIYAAVEQQRRRDRAEPAPSAQQDPAVEHELTKASSATPQW
jgi:hypothetical protein